MQQNATVLLARTLQPNIVACRIGHRSCFMLTATVSLMNELIFGLVFDFVWILVLLDQVRFFMPTPDQTGMQRHNICTLSVHLSTCVFYHSSVAKLVNTVFQNEWTDFDANWCKWSMGQVHETINFGVQEVKGQGNMMSEVDLEMPRSSSFSSFLSVNFFKQSDVIDV